jgi:hypothetical protein
MTAVGERHMLAAEVAMWLSRRGLGGAEVLAVASNDWVDQQSPVGVREWHRALEASAERRERRREEVA